MPVCKPFKLRAPHEPARSPACCLRDLELMSERRWGTYLLLWRSVSKYGRLGGIASSVDRGTHTAMSACFCIFDSGRAQFAGDGQEQCTELGLSSCEFVDRG